MKKIHRKGRIEVITGPMYAGKTEELIRRIRRAQFANEKIVVFKPAVDDRYAESEVVSHDNSRTKSINIVNSIDILNHVDEYTDVVAIDELQFFDDDIVDVVEQLASHNIRVIVSGLDMNFRGDPFHPIPELLSLAEEVDKLTAVCVVCHADATRTQRIVNKRPARYDDPEILVGATESYEARCRHCHSVPGKPKNKLSK